VRAPGELPRVVIEKPEVISDANVVPFTGEKRA
jgi:hypothetical protein